MRAIMKVVLEKGLVAEHAHHDYRGGDFVVQNFFQFFNNHPITTILLVLNSLSFLVMRVYWYSSEKFGAELEVFESAPDGGKMYYLVAGCVNQPHSAFCFLADELDGGITLVNYRAVQGCSIKTIAEQVVEDAERHRYDVRVVGISIGDYVARRVEAEIPGAKSVAINPEPDAGILRPYANVASKVGSVLVEALTVPLGWLSAIPWYNGCGNYFSTAFIADQFRDIGFIRSYPNTTKPRLGSYQRVEHATNGTAGVIISERPGKAAGDEFLSNSSIREYFGDVPIAVAKTGHGNTVDGATEFLEAWRELDLEDF